MRGTSFFVWAIVAHLVGGMTSARARVWYVAPDGVGTGVSWESPLGSISAGLTGSASGDEFWVREGRYHGTLLLRPYVSLYGGFSGHETERFQRDWAASESILDGSGIGQTIRGAAGAILDGFVVTGGAAVRGAGMYCKQAPGMTIRNCVVRDNIASGDAGGIFVEDSSGLSIIDCTVSGNSGGDAAGLYVVRSAARIERCVFEGNTAQNRGGGVFCYLNPSAHFVDCVFTGNRSQYRGGGLHCYNASPILTACLFLNNQADERGGGLFLEVGSAAVLEGCEIRGNSAGEKGGGVYANNSPAVFRDCRFQGNTALYHGGGASLEQDVSNPPSLERCQFLQNRAEGGGGIHFRDSYARNEACVFLENTATCRGGALMISRSSPTISDSTVEGNTAIKEFPHNENDAFGGGIYLGNSSAPTLTRCMIRSNYSRSSVEEGQSLGGGVFSVSSSPRFLFCTFEDNESDRGGAFHGYQSDALLEDCILTGNRATEHGSDYTSLGLGGAIYSEESDTTTLVRCMIDSNEAIRGGAFYCEFDSNTRFERSTIANNRSDSDGGAFFYYLSGGTVVDCLIERNASGGDGGAFHMNGSSITVERCAIIENTTVRWGGGAYFWRFQPTESSASIFTNCVIAANRSQEAACFYSWNDSPFFLHCSFVSNIADLVGGLFHVSAPVGSCDLRTQPSIVGSVIWGNVPDNVSGNCFARVSHSCSSYPFSGDGNITSNPLLAPPSDRCGRYGHLLFGSPCIDTAPVGTAPNEDVCGYTRPFGAGPDKGAHEFSEVTVIETPTPLQTQTPTPTVPVSGVSADINGDGIVDNRDLFLLMRQWHGTGE